MIPVTEMSNVITKDIDTSSPSEIVKLLRACDAEVFNGWEGSEGLMNKEFLEQMTLVAQTAQRLIQETDDSSVILSGCGTSGRLAFITATNFNKQLVQLGYKPCFDYLIAGGDEALFMSKESPEDNPVLGKSELRQISSGKKKVLYVGITCGFSAAYVAGQLEYCMDNLDRFIPVIMGFNPVSCARSEDDQMRLQKVTGAFVTFTVLTRLEKVTTERKGFILNPILGPEPITGSTRMKDGTATKVILESIFTSALLPIREKLLKPNDLEKLLREYQMTCEEVYKEEDSLCKFIEYGCKSLKEVGRICYVSSDSTGVMCLIDASECPPTFGADASEVRGYLKGGYSNLNNKEGDLSSQISTAYFHNTVLPSLTENDLIVVLHLGGNIEIPSTPAKILSAVINTSTAKTMTSGISTQYDFQMNIEKQSCQSEFSGIGEFKQRLQKEIAIKWLCNCLTTGAYCCIGKVFCNYMVDVQVRNSKLFHRAAGIIETFCICGTGKAVDLLLRSIYQSDTVPKDLRASPVSTHIEKATSMDKVVPCALVLGLANCSVDEARKILRETPVARTAIARFSK